MDDSKIIDLFYARSEQAIMELSTKYGAVCSKVAKNILNNSHDAEECVNDAYLGAWNTIPPQNPNPLLTYICRIVRNLSIMKYHSNTAIKRNSFYDAALDELEDCLASSETVEDKLTAKEPVEAGAALRIHHVLYPAARQQNRRCTFDRPDQHQHHAGWDQDKGL